MPQITAVSTIELTENEPCHFFDTIDVDFDDLSRLSGLIQVFLTLRDRFEPEDPAANAQAQALHEGIKQDVGYIAQDFGIQKAAIADFMTHAKSNGMALRVI